MGASAVRIPDGTKEKKELFGLIKKEVPKFRYAWQKNANMSLFSPKFYPHDYQGKDYNERKRHAYDAAKNTRRFYQDLVDQKVLPEGTSIKVRRIRHEDGFGLEFFMPHLQDIPEHTSLRQIFLGIDSAKDKTLKRKFEEGKKRCQDLIQKTASRYGETHGAAGLGQDVYPDRNYGINKEGEVRIHDIHVLAYELPSKFKLPEMQRKGQWYNRDAGEGSRKKTFLSILCLSSIISLIYFLGGNSTGFIVKETSGRFNLAYLIVFIIDVFIVGFIFKKIYNRYNN